MTQEKTQVHKGQKDPDELQREIWQYRRIWIFAILFLIACRLLLPHLRILHGWEQKFSLAIVEIGKGDIPEGALRIISPDEAVNFIKGEILLEPHALDFDGPRILSVWKCAILAEKGFCARYFWKGQPMTLAIISQPKNRQEIHDPFTKSGWSGYFIIHKGVVMVMVSAA